MAGVGAGGCDGGWMCAAVLLDSVAAVLEVEE